jgi:FdhD protein
MTASSCGSRDRSTPVSGPELRRDGVLQDLRGASIDDVAVRATAPEGPAGREAVGGLSLPDTLRLSQSAFVGPAGCTPRASSTDGSLFAIREDVGPPQRPRQAHRLAREVVTALGRSYVSGQVSFEIVRRPRSPGFDHLRRLGALGSRRAARGPARRPLVGFLRGDGFNVYSHGSRIDLHDLLGA